MSSHFYESAKAHMEFGKDGVVRLSLPPAQKPNSEKDREIWPDSGKCTVDRAIVFGPNGRICEIDFRKPKMWDIETPVKEASPLKVPMRGEKRILLVQHEV